VTKKIHERVLLDNGMFGHFPERYIDKAVELELREPTEEPIEEPLIPHGQKGKAELSGKKAKSKK
jgi:hypothetical protein